MMSLRRWKEQRLGSGDLNSIGGGAAVANQGSSFQRLIYECLHAMYYSFSGNGDRIPDLRVKDLSYKIAINCTEFMPIRYSGDVVPARPVLLCGHGILVRSDRTFQTEQAVNSALGHARGYAEL